MPASFKHLTDRKVGYNSLLARWKDGLYYTAVLTKCDRAKNRCRVCFEDGSEIWASNRDLHIQISLDKLNEDDDIVCCICDDGNSEPPNEIILCDVCNQGYHQKCHQPPVDSSKLDDSEETKDHKDWFCATCSYILNQTNRAKLSATVAAAQQRQAPAQTSKSSSETGPSSPKQPRLVATSSSTPTPSPQHQPKIQTQPTEVVPKSHASVAGGHVAPVSTTGSSPSAVGSTMPTNTVTTTTAAVASNQTQIVRQPPKVKQTPTISQQQQLQQSNQKSTPVKVGQGLHQRSAPYYPLSSQVRAAGSASSTAALASMTASSALVVGSAAGRSKQDIVKQANKSAQRQFNSDPAATASLGSETGAPVLPKHAVRKSSVNFVVAHVKQSALPTAVRSTPSLATGSSSLPTIIRDQSSAHTLSTTSHSTVAKPIITMTVPSTAPTVTSHAANASYTITALTTQPKTSAGVRGARNDIAETSIVRANVNGQSREPKSVISTSGSLQQISGLSAPTVIDSSMRPVSTAQTKSSEQVVEVKRSIGIISSSTSCSPQRLDSAEQLNAAPNNSNNNLNRSSNNSNNNLSSHETNASTGAPSTKATSVIVANLK